MNKQLTNYNFLYCKKKQIKFSTEKCILQDSTLSEADTVTKRWMAGIQIEDGNESHASRPRVYVLPLRKYLARNVSITTL